MKSAEFIQAEIAKLMVKAQSLDKYDKKEKKEINSIKKRMAFMRTCMFYVQTNPDKDFLTREKERLYNRINAFMKDYVPLADDKFKKSDVTKHRASFEKEMDIPKLRKFITTINFILN